MLQMWFFLCVGGWAIYTPLFEALLGGCSLDQYSGSPGFSSFSKARMTHRYSNSSASDLPIILLHLNIAMDLNLRHLPSLSYRVSAIREDQIILFKMRIVSLEVVEVCDGDGNEVVTRKIKYDIHWPTVNPRSGKTLVP